MVSALESGLKDPGLRTGLVIVLKCYARHFILKAPFSTQEYKCETANFQSKLTKLERLTSHLL